MSQSLSMFYIHATFATKNRQNWIQEDSAPKLHAYMASVLIELNSPALIINSMPDHVHILFRMSKTITAAELMEQVKKNSSKWIKQQPFGKPSFYWQKGYGAFSVSASNIDAVCRYIKRQKEHHRKMTYREEIDRLMKKYRVEGYKPNYYWN